MHWFFSFLRETLEISIFAALLHQLVFQHQNKSKHESKVPQLSRHLRCFEKVLQEKNCKASTKPHNRIPNWLFCVPKCYFLLRGPDDGKFNGCLWHGVVLLSSKQIIENLKAIMKVFLFQGSYLNMLLCCFRSRSPTQSYQLRKWNAYYWRNTAFPKFWTRPNSLAFIQNCKWWKHRNIHLLLFFHKTFCVPLWDLVTRDHCCAWSQRLHL